MHLRDDFSASGPVSQVPASWFNKVAKFINNLIPGEGVEFDKHDDGSLTIVKAKTFEEQEEKTLSDMFEAVQVGTDSQYDLYFYPPKFDKYGRFSGYGERTLILGGIYAG